MCPCVLDLLRDKRGVSGLVPVVKLNARNIMMLPVIGGGAHGLPRRGAARLLPASDATGRRCARDATIDDSGTKGGP